MKYSELVSVYGELDKTTKRLDKTNAIANFLRKVKADDIELVMLLLQGRIYPKWDDRKIGVASKLVLKAIVIATGIDSAKVETMWRKEGDLGAAAEKLVGKKKQATLFSQDLSVSKVYKNLQSLSTLEGAGTVDKKVKLIAELLTSASPAEARYIVRTVLEEMRVGVGEGTLRDAIVWAYFWDELGLEIDTEKGVAWTKEFKKDKEKWNNYLDCVNKVQEALDVTNDYAKVALVAKEKGVKGLDKIELKVDKPIKAMLYQKAADFEDAFERVGVPAAFEYKYDGFRIQIHKKGNIVLYTRRLENVTHQFPDVVSAVEKNIKSDNFILDAEIVGVSKGKFLAFQNISQRIKRKYEIEKMVKEIPVMVVLFDAMSIDGENLLKVNFSDRREKLKGIVKESKGKLELAKQVITSKVGEAKKFYEDALKVGNEGVMAKNLSAPYKPGSRVGYGVKIKPIMETLDLVIVGAEWGEGKRSKWLSTFVVACQDEDGQLLEIGKVGTGIKEKAEEGTSFEELTELLKPLITAEDGKEVKVKAKIVIEVNYEEIQKSPTYNSGYALRFPRLVKLREDKPVDEVSSLDMVEELYFDQRGRG